MNQKSILVVLGALLVGVVGYFIMLSQKETVTVDKVAGCVINDRVSIIKETNFLQYRRLAKVLKLVVAQRYQQT